MQSFWLESVENKLIVGSEENSGENETALKWNKEGANIKILQFFDSPVRWSGSAVTVSRVYAGSLCLF